MESDKSEPAATGRLSSETTTGKTAPSDNSPNKNPKQRDATAPDAEHAPEHENTVPCDNSGIHDPEFLADRFAGLSMQTLVEAPLSETIKAQQMSAKTIRSTPLEISSSEHPVSRGVEFLYTGQPGHGPKENAKRKIRVPYLAIVPIPSIAIDRIDVDFSMEVSRTENTPDPVSSAPDKPPFGFGIRIPAANEGVPEHEVPEESNSR